jgi:hypothetical protein
VIGISPAYIYCQALSILDRLGLFYCQQTYPFFKLSYLGGNIMFERVHAQSDLLKGGKIMLPVDCEPGCYTLTDLEYSEHALRELLVDTHKTIQEAIEIKNNLTFETYVTILVSLTNNLKTITDSLLAVKTNIQATQNSQGKIIAESYQMESIEYSGNKLW